MNLAGADGCREGWLCLKEVDGVVHGHVFASFAQILRHLPDSPFITIDIPIGLPTSGERACDRMARQLLGSPRSSSVFPAPVRGVVQETHYQVACEKHRQIDGRALSKQAFAILPKIREVNEALWQEPTLQQRVREVHPEVCFAVWNNGRAMQHRKAIPAGRAERERLIDAGWPGQRPRILAELAGHDFELDDVNDAFAALWTAKRVAVGSAKTLGSKVNDAGGLRMEMWA